MARRGASSSSGHLPSCVHTPLSLITGPHPRARNSALGSVFSSTLNIVPTMSLLLIDNYDSFTHNLAHLLMGAGARVVVIRNDAGRDAAWEDPDIVGLVLSPGPGTPDQAGRCAEALRSCAGRMPVLGVCLGMQVINAFFGGRTVRAPLPVHGKTDVIDHDGTDLFLGLPHPLTVARYHSLAVDAVPDCLCITASSRDGVPMALRHREQAIFGVQFHPESYLTEGGSLLAHNFLMHCRGGGT